MYSVEYASERIEGFLRGLLPKIRKQIVSDIDKKLPTWNAQTRGVKYIKVLGRYRLRCGDYRVFFTAEGSVIKVHGICNRKDTPYK